ncbi:MAG TPA: hypothetical protein HPP83_11770 [Candidatus Hydrogenedentes bacterium]|nr:hypothetical protein [Candidatus Hydrogenedentota bacterium]
MPKPSCAQANESDLEHADAVFSARQKLALGLLAALGVLLRLVEYVHYRPLWSDESILAAHLLSDPTPALFRAMPDIIVPPGYFLLLKLCVAVVGVTEYAVRLPSVIASIAALGLLCAVGKRLCAPAAAVVALLFLAVSEHSIYYAAEVRPYALDAAVVLGLLWLTLNVRLGLGKAASWRLAAFALAGAVAVWLSYPAAFCLAGIAATQVLLVARKRQWRRLAPLFAVYGVWGLSFVALYFINIRSVFECEEMMQIAYGQYNYAGAFMPFPPKSLADARWFGTRFVMFCDHPLGLAFPGLVAFALVAGAGSLYARKKEWLLLLLFPLFFAMAASGLRKYPLHARTMLYLAPIAYLLIGEAAVFVSGQGKRPLAIGAVAMASILLLHPAYRAARDAASPRSHHELHRLLDYAEKNWEDGDVLYMPYVTHLSYLFCAHRYDFPKDAVIAGAKPAPKTPIHETFSRSLPQLRGKRRVWVALTYALAPRAERYWETLDEFGERGTGFHARGASVYLYDFSRAPAPPGAEPDS